MSWCLIGLGSNLDDRRAAIDGALEALARRPGVRALRRSRLLETAAIGGPSGQNSFLNAAAVFETALDPQAVLAILRQIEALAGRQRSQRWGPRTLDLDLLLYDELELCTPELTVPHPRMAWRRFVLEPAAEVAGVMRHPTTGWTIAHLLHHLNTAKNYLAITGPIAMGRRELAQQLAGPAPTGRLPDPADLAQLAAEDMGSAGHRERMELEFLEKRSRVLAVDSPVWAFPVPLWVSDFWFDECLPMADAWCAPRDARTSAQRWRAAAPNVVRPKLTVLLDVSTDRWSERTEACKNRGLLARSREELDRLRSAFRACLRRSDVGPVMCLTDESLERASEEVSAATAAMR